MFETSVNEIVGQYSVFNENTQVDEIYLQGQWHVDLLLMRCACEVFVDNRWLSCKFDRLESSFKLVHGNFLEKLRGIVLIKVPIENSNVVEEKALRTKLSDIRVKAPGAPSSSHRAHAKHKLANVEENNVEVDNDWHTITPAASQDDISQLDVVERLKETQSKINQEDFIGNKVDDMLSLNSPVQLEFDNGIVNINESFELEPFTLNTKKTKFRKRKKR